MKNLRHLLRRPFGSSKRRQRDQAPRTQQRRLRSEALEKRELLAGDILHNQFIPTDVDASGQTTTLDALLTINALQRKATGQVAEQESLGDPIDRWYDVNDNGTLEPADALGIINALQRGPELESPVVDFFVTARDLNDNEIVANASGEIEVSVNEDFFIELSYSDLRATPPLSPRADTGAFEIRADIGFSETDNLIPVLTESQLVVVDEAFVNARTGDYIISLEGSTDTFTTSVAAFGAFGGAATEIGNALEQFGYTSDQFTVTPTLLSGDDFDNFGFFIRYDDYDAHGNVDLPNITVTQSDLRDENGAAVDAPARVISTPPINSDGTINGSAIADNLFLDSRTLNGGDNAYSLTPSGDFTEAGGFTRVGGAIENLAIGGIPAISNDGSFEEPFDTFAIRVRVTQPTAGLDVSASPAANEDDAVLLFDAEPPRVPASMVGLTNATITIVAAQDVTPLPPVVGGPLTLTLSEDDPTRPFNLLSGANDPNGDTINVAAGATTSGDDQGITINGNSITIDPSQYDSLLDNETATAVVSYSITDGTLSTPQTATITITGVTDNGDPTNSTVTATFEDTDNPANVNLLANADDPDGDTLTVSGVSIRAGSGDSSGITIDAANARLAVTPQDYGELNDGESVVVTYDYTVSDGNGGSVAGVAIVTINGNNAPDGSPVVSGPVTAGFIEDGTGGVVNLLIGSSDPQGDPLSVLNLALSSGDSSGITAGATTLSVDPSGYDSLAEGATEQIVYTYVISDDQNNTVNQSATVTITGINDAPTVSGDLTDSFNESDASRSVDLLGNASDIDTGDAAQLTISNLVNIAGGSAGITQSGNSLVVDPSAYSNLNAGETATPTFTYDISDPSGASVSTRVTISINGEGTTVNNTPVLATMPLTGSFDESDASTTFNLLTGATDPDGDTLNVSGAEITSGNAAGVTISGNSLSINPSAYVNLLDAGQSELVVVSYNVTDGTNSVAQTAEITINGEGGVGDTTQFPPVVSGAVVAMFAESDATNTVNLLANASDANNDTLNVSNVVATGNAIGITVNGNTLSVDPSAYAALNANQSEVITYTYSIDDGTGLSVNQTATITINGESDPVGNGSVGGTLFIDHINNPAAVAQGAAPVRDGIKDADEPALASILVTLTSSTGQVLTTTTDLEGEYLFTNLNPGTYDITYDIPDGLLFTGASSSQLTVGSSAVTGVALEAIGYRGALGSLDILASSYIASNQEMSVVSDGGLQGGTVALDSLGEQQAFIAGLGLEGVEFAELSLNDDQDAALLTVLDEDGNVRSARLSSDHFVVSRDGSAVQFFGGIEDFDFADSSESLLRQEFATFRNAIDQILAQQGS